MVYRSDQPTNSLREPPVCEYQDFRSKNSALKLCGFSVQKLGAKSGAKASSKG